MEFLSLRIIFIAKDSKVIIILFSHQGGTKNSGRIQNDFDFYTLVEMVREFDWKFIIVFII